MFSRSGPFVFDELLCILPLDMRFRWTVVLYPALVLCVLLSGCAGVGGATGSVRTDIGTSTRGLITRVTSNLLQGQYGYRLETKAEQSENIRYITYWVEHSPLEDERKMGYTAVRTRVSVFAKPKNRSAKTYRVAFKADYMVKKASGSNWVRAEITEGREEELDKIVRDLEDKLTSGVMEY